MEKSVATCEICAREITKPHRSHGLTLCGTCKAIMPGVSKHLQSLIKMIRAIGKTGEVAEMLGLSAAGAASDDARHNLEAVVQDARATLIKALPPASESLDETQTLYDIADLAEEAAWHIAALTEERDKLADQIKAAGQERMDVWQTGNADPLDEALLRWAKRQHQAGRVRVQMEVVEVGP